MPIRAVFLTILLLLSAAVPVARAQATLDLLAPPDTSSPRATLASFQAAAGEASRLLYQAYRQRVAEGGLFASASVAAKVRRAERLLDRAARTLDLSKINEVTAESERIGAVLMLKEMLDRIPLPDPPAIPDAAPAAAGDTPLAHWTIPGTEIRLARIGEGERTGEYLFSAESVARLADTFALIRDLPARQESVAIYDFYGQTPGHLLPPVWFELIRLGPAWLGATYADQAMWQWLGLALLVAVAGAALFGLFRLRRIDLGAHRLARNMGRLFMPAAVFTVTWLLLAGVDELNFRGEVLAAMESGSAVVEALALAWVFLLACNGIAAVVLESPAVMRNNLDANLLRAGFRVLGIGGAAVIVGYAATLIGIPLVGVLAGLGVGGLAIALAAQPTIENFIGGVILYADRPVRSGDFCQFGEQMGTVEEIGIRSTRVRMLDRSVVTVPNSDFANLSLVNFSRADCLFLETTLSFRRETLPEQICEVVAKLRDMLLAHPKVMRQDLGVHLDGIGESSLDVKVEAYLATTDWEEFDAIREELLLKAMELAAACNVAFALPSQTTYLGADPVAAPERWSNLRAALAELRAG